MTSIRRKLTSTVLGGTLAVWLVCGAGLYAFMRYALTREFDMRAADQSRAFAAFTEYEEAGYTEETRMNLESLPPSIRALIMERASPADIEEIERVIREGQVFYKVEVVEQGAEREFLIAGSGEYLGAIDEFAFAYSRAALPEFQPGPDAAYFQVWDEDGKTVARSPSLNDGSLIPHRDMRNRAAFDIVLPDKRPGRALVSAFTPPGSDEPLRLAIARSRADLDRALWTLLSTLLISCVAMAAFTLWLVRRNIREGLAPLNKLAAEADAIGADDLSHRFSESALPDELLPIASRLNQLLSRLGQAFEREKRFTSDVAHELRTPIAELRALAEVGLDGALDGEGPGGNPAYFRDALDIAIQMERLVEHLLTLRRSESGDVDLVIANVDLAELTRRAWTPFQRTAEARSLHTAFDLPEDATLETDPALLSAILTNLFANAVAYTPPGGRIHLNVRGDNGAWRVEVSNPCPVLDEADVAQMTEPFWRKDAARADASHAGLGLAIATAFAKLLGAEFNIQLDGGTMVRVSLLHPKQRNATDQSGSK